MSHRPLTEKGRQALEKALHVPIARDDDGRLPLRVSVLDNLVDKGYLEAIQGDRPGDAVWTISGYAITQAGRDALKREIPRFLHQRPHRNYTSNPALAARGEPEAVDDTTLDRYAQHAGQQRARTIADQQRAVEELKLSAQLARLEHEAASAGVDLRRQMAKVQATIRAAERRLRRDVA